LLGEPGFFKRDNQVAIIFLLLKQNFLQVLSIQEHCS